MATLQEIEAELSRRGLSRQQQIESELSKRGLDVVNQKWAAEQASNIDGVPNQPQPDQETRTVGDALKGAFETGIALVGGGLAGSYGYVGGLAESLVREAASGQFDADRIRQLTEQRAAEFARPFMPESEAGREYTQTISELLGNIPMIPQLAIEHQALKSLGRAGLQVIPAKTKVINDNLAQAAKVVREQAFKRNQQSANLPLGSVGAQALSDAQIRAEAAKNLPVPIQLTKGQSTREFDQQRFERETAKLEDVGEPLRQRFADQNSQLIQNFDSFIDEVGAELYYPLEIGESVVKAIRADAAKDKAKIRTLYNQARESGEMGKKVDLNPLSDYLNANRAERAENSIMTKTQRQLEVLEVAGGSFEEGTLSLRQMSLNEAEAVRRFINRNVNDADPNDVRIATNLKNLIDASTEGQGGEKYKAARKARFDYAEKFENVGLIDNLLTTKRGTVDRKIALEDVVRKSVISSATPYQSTYHLRKLLQNAGEEGKQAWRELQGSTLRHLQDQMTKNVARNERGDPVVSAAALDRELMALDRNGKLDLLFGKSGAQKLRTINDVAKVVLTSPPGSVNHSNTATVLAGLMDIAVSGSSGVPAPVFTSVKLLTDGLKDKKLKKRVTDALKTEEE